MADYMHPRKFKNTNIPAPRTVPEPSHRIGPEGVSSGISIREFPKSNVQQVREICKYYVKKCSGKYEDNKAAARYVYQMADEIIKQLSSVSSQIKRFEDEPEVFQALLNEWNEHFPPSLGSMGSPKAIASRLAAQANEIEILKLKLQEEKDCRLKDMNDIMKSLDSQLSAAKISMIAEQSQHKRSLEEKEKYYDRLIIAQKDKYENLLAEVKLQNSLSQRNWSDKVEQLQKQLQSINKQHDNEILEMKESYDAQISAMEASFMREKRDMKDKIVSVETKLRNVSLTALESSLKSVGTKSSTLNIPFSGALGGNTNANDEDDAVSIDLSLPEVENEMEIDEDDETEDDDETDDEEAEAQLEDDVGKQNNEEERKIMDLLSDVKSVTKDHKKKNRKSKKTRKASSKSKEKRKVTQKLKLSGPVGAAIKKLKMNIEELSLEKDEAIKQMKISKEEKQRYLLENQHLKSELDNLLSLQSIMKSTIASSMKSTCSARVIDAKPVVLSHTPHFLQHDHNGARHYPQKISAYNGYGHF